MTSNPTLLLGGEIPVHRLGFGAMRLTGWTAGTEEEQRAGIAVAQRAVELGVSFIDTADAYALGANEELLAAALHPYPEGVVIATKAGQSRPGGGWQALGRPEYLRQQAELSLRRLRVDRIELFQLHRVDPQVPFTEQLGALKQLQDEGKVRFLGLSEVSVEQLEEARRHVEIVSVQNRYNVTDRGHQKVLDYCTREDIAFIPWLPVALGRPDTGRGALAEIAAELGASPVQVALAWQLAHSPVTLPIPGTKSVAHLAENVAAAELTLSADQLARLDALG